MTALPPGPRMPPALQTLGWVTRAVPFLERCRRRYGDAFTLRLANEPPYVVLADPAAIRDLFAAKPAVARAGEGNALLEPLVGPNSVLILDGREHLAQRRLLLPPFHGDRLARQRALMQQVAEEEIARWPATEPFAALPRMQSLTLEIIIRVVLGVEREDARAAALRDTLASLLDAIQDRRVLLPIFLFGGHRLQRLPPLSRLLRAVDERLLALVRDRRDDPHAGEAEDVLSLLLSASHEDGRPMDDAELRDELVTLLVAGHETTATALAWALERIVRHPDAYARLQQGDETWTDAVVKETLRLRPPITIVARRLTAPLRVGDLELPAGVAATPCIPLVHRRPDVYPDPHAFRPERFLDQPPGTYTWIPFGGGVRRCLGAAFAELEMRVVLQALVGARRLHAPDARPERRRRRTIVMAPEHGGRIVAAQRSATAR